MDEHRCVWSPERDIELVHLLNQGLEIPEMARSLSFLDPLSTHSVIAVKNRMVRLRRTAVSRAEYDFWTRSKSVWTVEREWELAFLWSAWIPMSHIAKKLGFLSGYADGGKSAVSRHIDYLRDTAKSESERAFWTRKGKKKPPRKNPWTPDADERLARLWHSGMSAEDIAAALGFFVHTRDSGRSAVCGRVARNRETAVNDAEKAFWSRGRVSIPRAHRKDGHAKKRTSVIARAATAKAPEARSQAKRERSKVLERHEINQLIESVPAPNLKVTDADVTAAWIADLTRQSVRNSDQSESWSSPRRPRSERPQFRPRCTEPFEAGPCGKDVVGKTARCKEHGGELLDRIQFTPEYATKPRLIAAE